jgi:hypothetical protein
MSEPSFDNAGQKAGLELWRIENMAPVKMPEASGAFHTGVDSRHVFIVVR